MDLPLGESGPASTTLPQVTSIHVGTAFIAIQPSKQQHTAMVWDLAQQSATRLHEKSMNKHIAKKMKKKKGIKTNSTDNDLWVDSKILDKFDVHTRLIK